MINKETGEVASEAPVVDKWEVKAKEILSLVKGLSYWEANAILENAIKRLSEVAIVG
jgi:hypothetical protein